MLTDESMELLKNNEITKHTFEIVPEYLHNLDDYQKIVAQNIHGNFLVLAGPGAGKTHTLIFRIVHMIYTGIDPREICVITFTRRAAFELKHRIDKLMPGVELGFVGTFHALAIFLYNSTGGQKSRLIDAEDDIHVISLVKEVHKINFTNNIRAKKIQKIFSYSYNTLLDIEHTIIKMGYEDLKIDLQSLVKLEKLYTDYKVMNNLKTYDDILRLKCGDSTQFRSFSYLMIDEYQDTNNLQINFVKNIFSNKNIMAIGDEFQSIYSFRGSNPNIILNFANDFPEAKLIILKNNYRSDDEIVEKINQVINTCDYGFKKTLIPNNFSDEEVEVTNIAHKNDYTDFIINNIKEKEGTHALIYRAGRERGKLESKLIKENIDYTVYGGIRLLERAHIKDVISIILTAYSKTDEISFLRSLKIIEGVGNVRASDIIRNYPNTHRFQTNSLITEYLKLIEKDLSPTDFVKAASTWYFKNKRHLSKSSYLEEEILLDIDLLVNISQDYDSILNFINDLVLDPVHDKSTNAGKCRVFLTTIHSCKGLEFDYVYHLHGTNFWGMYDIDATEENRRLFYVAISRAKHKLYILDQRESLRPFEEILLDFKLDGYMNKAIENPRLADWNNLIDLRLNDQETKLKEIKENNKLKYLILKIDEANITALNSEIDVNFNYFTTMLLHQELVTVEYIISLFYGQFSVSENVEIKKNKITNIINLLNEKDFEDLKYYLSIVHKNTN